MQYCLTGGSRGPPPEDLCSLRLFLMQFERYFKTHWFVLLPISPSQHYSYKYENAGGGGKKLSMYMLAYSIPYTHGFPHSPTSHVEVTHWLNDTDPAFEITVNTCPANTDPTSLGLQVEGQQLHNFVSKVRSFNIIWH